MYKNSEKFIASFNRIDKQLKAELTDQTEVGFSKAVKILQHHNATVKHYRDQLLEYAELRNAIIHNRVDMTYVIAEPHDSVVEEVLAIEQELLSPKMVKDFAVRKVYTFQESDTAEEALHLVRQQAISKFPVYRDEAFTGLLTQKGITRWLANQMGGSFFPSPATLLGEMLRYKANDNYKFVDKEMTLYAAADFFKKQIGAGRRLEALLITENGEPEEDIAGIMTAFDMLDL